MQCDDINTSLYKGKFWPHLAMQFVNLKMTPSMRLTFTSIPLC
jgi:hypothetical protein